MDFPQIASLAANEALSAGVEKDSHEYWKAIEEGFDKHMAALKAQAIPKFFEPLPSPPPPAPRGPAHFVSAPVSKTVPDGSLREWNPSQVRLSAEEVEHARVSGISATEYARQKLRLAREKAAGLRQNG